MNQTVNTAKNRRLTFSENGGEAMIIRASPTHASKLHTLNIHPCFRNTGEITASKSSPAPK
jgi:hypothetical protein